MRIIIFENPIKTKNRQMGLIKDKKILNLYCLKRHFRRNYLYYNFLI